MKVLVCGGRDFDNRELIFRVLDRLHAWRTIERIIHGGADGADSFADEWVRFGLPLSGDTSLVELSVFEANWKSYGMLAGPIRNERMLRDSKPDLVVAFPGGRGTKDMVERARKVTAVIVISPNGHRVTCYAPDSDRAYLAMKLSRIALGDNRTP